MTPAEKRALVVRYMTDDELAEIILGDEPKRTLARHLRDEIRDSYDDEDAQGLRTLADELDPPG